MLTLIRGLISRIGAIEERVKHLEVLCGYATGTQGQQVQSNKQGVIETQDAACELSEDVDARISDLEDAICELSEAEVK